MPFFSIIIPLYNKENFIVNTLSSVFNQSFTDFEVIIINDGSTDLSEQKVFQLNDKRIRYLKKENEGVSIARNKGIEMAQSEYITFLDADDFWYPDFLTVMFQHIKQLPEQLVFVSAIEIETGFKTIPANYSIPKTNEFQIVNFFKASRKETVIWTSSAVFHHSVFKKIGDFDVTIKSGQDTDLWIRIGVEYSIVFIPKVLARYVFDSNSLSKNKKYTTTKINFSKFSSLEKTNLDLKNYLDLNRYALALKSKMNGNKSNFNVLYDAIDLKELSLKKRILLKMPAIILKQLVLCQSVLIYLGLRNTVFK